MEEEVEESSPIESAQSESQQSAEFSLIGRPFLAAIFEALNCSENDYLPLFALCLLYAIQDNPGKKAHCFCLSLGHLMMEFLDDSPIVNKRNLHKG